ncbi:MAG TPA: L,D-transpeptidase family protein [Flavobacterium sp.]
MNKFFTLLILFSVLSCKKEPIKKDSVPKKEPIATPVIKLDGKGISFDSVLLNSFDSKIFKEFYKSVDYQTVWQSKKNRQLILKQLSISEEEGLNPADYHLSKLQKYERKIATLNKQEIIDYDFLLTRNFQRYIAHLNSGRLNPIELYEDWDLKENKIDINNTIILAIKNDSLAQKIEQTKPNHIVYQKLKEALKIINTFPKDKFTRIDTTNRFVPKDTNSLLIDIKKRLIYWRDLRSKDSLTTIYDRKTVEAVKKFQFRHGLVADGIIGKGTISALNFSKNQRKGQIIANLERWKWFPKEMGNEYIIVNIPAYKLTVVENNEIIRTHKVVVGSLKRKTPVLSSKLSSTVFNPTWTLPPTIIEEDIIPAITKDKNYLVEKNIKVYDTNGDSVSTNNWQLEKAKNYRYVQSPGTFNSLGMVKILFPNRFFVYLHDTNHRDLFAKSMRSLSSGCVRVQNPLALTEYLLNDTVNWNIDKITETLKSQKTKQIRIKKEVFVHILYWTAWSEDSRLIFRNDIYNLDAELFNKLRS